MSSKPAANDLLAMIKNLDADVGLRRPEDLQGRHPGTHPDNFAAGVMALPADTQAVVALVELCRDAKIEIVPQGGRTGLVGGTISAPGQLILSTERMNRIESIDIAAGIAIVQAGVTLEALQIEAARFGLEPGVDLGSRGTATIGGMISTNAGGIQAFRNGVMRHRVFGLEAVLPDGTILGDLTTVVKSTGGYDVKQIFVGGEGSFGIVTRAAIKLEPIPVGYATAMIAVPDAATGLQVANYFASSAECTLLAAEMMWQDYTNLNAEAHNFALPEAMAASPAILIVQISSTDRENASRALEDGLASLWEQSGITDGIVATSLEQEKRIWHLREDTSTFGRKYPGYMSFDVSVPSSEADAYIARIRERLNVIEPGLKPIIFGHIADGNLHVIPQRGGPYSDSMRDAVQRALYEDLQAMGGSFSAEHGVGTKKREAFEMFADKGKKQLAMILKTAIDPDNLFNPGKVIRLVSDQ